MVTPSSLLLKPKVPLSFEQLSHFLSRPTHNQSISLSALLQKHIQSHLNCWEGPLSKSPSHLIQLTNCPSLLTSFQALINTASSHPLIHNAYWTKHAERLHTGCFPCELHSEIFTRLASHLQLWSKVTSLTISFFIYPTLFFQSTRHLLTYYKPYVCCLLTTGM